MGIFRGDHMETEGKISTLLNEYKQLINFNDKMQKGNYKFVNWYIQYYKKKKQNNWIEDCIEFLTDAIDLQHKVMKRA